MTNYYDGNKVVLACNNFFSKIIVAFCFSGRWPGMIPSMTEVEAAMASLLSSIATDGQEELHDSEEIVVQLGNAWL